jgi:hypothetical protein
VRKTVVRLSETASPDQNHAETVDSHIPVLPRRVGITDAGVGLLELAASLAAEGATGGTGGGALLGTGGGALVGTGGGGLEGSGGGAEPGLTGEYCGAAGGSCTERPCTLGSASVLAGFGGFVIDSGRAGLTGEAVDRKSVAGVGDTGACAWTGAWGADTYAADVGAGPDLSGLSTFAPVDDFPEPLGTPPGPLPAKQWSHTFCGVVLWMCGMIWVFLRWSEHTRLPHLRQWCRRFQKVNS